MPSYVRPRHGAAECWLQIKIYILLPIQPSLLLDRAARFQYSMLPDAPHGTCTRCKRTKPLVLFAFARGQTGPSGDRIATCTPCADHKKAQKKLKSQESKKKEQDEGNKENENLCAAVDMGSDGNAAGLWDIGLEDFLTIIGGHRGSIQLEANVNLVSLEKSTCRKEKADKLAQRMWEAMNLRFRYVVNSTKF